MVRVFKCHGFKSATVVPVSDEPLAVCADDGLVFVATRQCTIKIFKRNEDDGSFVEWRCIGTICTAEKMAYNKYSEYHQSLFFAVVLFQWTLKRQGCV